MLELDLRCDIFFSVPVSQFDWCCMLSYHCLQHELSSVQSSATRSRGKRMMGERKQGQRNRELKNRLNYLYDTEQIKKRRRLICDEYDAVSKVWSGNVGVSFDTSLTG